MIPVSAPVLSGNEKKYVNDCLKSNWISSGGKYNTLFEKKFASFCGCSFGVACSSGTAALHLAILSLGISEGDEVIIPDFTMIATSNAVIYAGAKPVLVDADRRTWCINPKLIEEKITGRTKAIIAVHIYGHMCDMDRINDIAKKHNLLVIEDAAEAHGAIYKGKMAGSLSDASCFSFYANKIITTGEGGMVVTNREDVAKKARYLANQAFEKKRFVHDEIGFNYRMTNISAAIGCAQTEKANSHIAMHRQHAALYRKLLSGVKGITMPPEEPYAKNVYWMFGILIEKEYGLSRDNLMKRLQIEGIETRPFFMPMHLQPAYRKNKKNFPNCTGKYPVSEELSAKGLYLPSGTGLSTAEIYKVAKAIIKIQNDQ